MARSGVSQSESSPSVTSTSAPEQMNKSATDNILCTQIRKHAAEEVKTSALCFAVFEGHATDFTQTEFTCCKAYRLVYSYVIHLALGEAF